MPKIVISGYYGFHNNGDEAILYAMLQALGNMIPGLEVTVLSREPDYTRREFNVRAISRNNPWQVFKALLGADMLISGGGGLLQDVTSPRSIVYYLGVMSMAMLAGKPVFCYAQGIGPVRTALGRRLVRLVVNHVKGITVRDPDSKDELAVMGVNRPLTQVTADPVLGLQPSRIDKQKGRDILLSLGLEVGAPVAGISVISWKGLRHYKEAVAKAADDLVAAGWQVLLVPMHNPADIEPCREVAAMMRKKPFILDTGIEYKEMLSLAANLDLAVGMRLHFLIFGAVSGVPLIGISYDPKVDRFLQSVGLPALYVEDLDHDALSHRIKQVIKEREAIGRHLEGQVALLRERALKNAVLVAELLQKDK